jgi:hypothetical protein
MSVKAVQPGTDSRLDQAQCLVRALPQNPPDAVTVLTITERRIRSKRTHFAVTDCETT